MKNKKSRATRKVKINETPPHSELINLLEHFEAGRFQQAEKKALVLVKNFSAHPFSWKVLGAIYKATGRLLESLSANQKSVQLAPKDSEAQCNLGVVFEELDNLNEAELCFRRAISINACHSEGHYNLGNILSKQGNLQEAESSFRKATSLNPEYADAHQNLGNTLKKLGKLDEAEATFRRSLTLNPKNASVLTNLGILMHDKNKLVEARILYNRAIELAPNNAVCVNNLGVTLAGLGSLEEAEANYRQAIQCKPDYADAYHNLGLLYVRRKEHEKARGCYDKALELDNNLTDVKWALSLLELSQGQFDVGWELYESRYHKNKSTRICTPPLISTPQYHGKNIKKDMLGKHFFICAEQGVGDEVMFASVLPNLASLIKINPDTKITIACDSRLVDLFNRSFNFLTAIPRDPSNCYETIANKLDFWIFIGSLPKFFRTSLKSFHDQPEYLIADAMLSSIWKDRLERLPQKFNIGISWVGGSNDKKKQDRSLILEKLSPILQKACENANIVNLQYGDHSNEIRDLQKKMGFTIYDWEDCDPLKDLENFAAQVRALDLVISVDNSTVHFAGALGTPTFMLTPFDQDWRWPEGENDCHWYPGKVKLFRQCKDNGDWGDVIHNISNSLNFITASLESK